jgi:hypothetical protein
MPQLPGWWRRTTVPPMKDNVTVIQVLAGVAGILAVLGIIKPAWPLAVGLLLVCVALFVGAK